MVMHFSTVEELMGLDGRRKRTNEFDDHQAIIELLKMLTLGSLPGSRAHCANLLLIFVSVINVLITRACLCKFLLLMYILLA